MTTKKPKTKPTKRVRPITDLEADQYGRGCLYGDKQAELYLHELRMNPELLSSSLLGSYVSKIRDYPADPRIAGRLVGFFSRVEREFARLITEDAWRASPWQDRWEFAKAAADKIGKRPS